MLIDLCTETSKTVYEGGQNVTAVETDMYDVCAVVGMFVG